ncbi:RDD family protein [Acidihalobacter aeolianus]|uniref:RDD family protein n=1 Tax=Acidihalobacter aeolianus TaxID=2792603 RepID=UPI0009F45004|nr:RDD family protein [Acidihalobacter aeolianus]
MDNRVGLPRRLLAMAYDGLLMFALLMIASALLIPFQHGQAVAPGNHLFQLYLLYVLYLFLAWFWVHGGQTLGMKAWRIRLVSDDGKPIGWTRATLRFFLSILSWLLLGTGFLWSLVDREKRCLHDILSHTRLIKIPSPSDLLKSSQSEQATEQENTKG